MRFEKYIDLSGNVGYSGLFFASGTFGIIDGNVDYIRSENGGKTIFEYCNREVKLLSEFSLEENGVVVRRDSIQNLSEECIEVTSLVSRFKLDGNEYEVYTQYNGWQHESKGEWQKLVTQITSETLGIRACDGATPMMGLHNLYTGKNTVFHLIANSKWHMTAKKIPKDDREMVVLELGFSDRALQLRLAPNEIVELPTIVFFDAESKIDFDAYKLHEWYNKSYPRRVLPVVYNSWLYCFDKLNVDELLRQVDSVADIGVEAFMIDAGWFGNGDDWSSSVGDWEENISSGPCGRLIEISERVRQRGMIFGLWFEPERASPASKAVLEHPDYYINGSLLDFSNPDAVEYMLGVISRQIDTYNIGWLKFDFNASIPTDPSKNGFYKYMLGQKNFIMRLRDKYPNIYITNCASGGYRMDLGQGMIFDSFWPSDNQGPYEGLRIVKDTLKRMPTGLVERWNVQKYCEDKFPVYANEPRGKMIHCNNATWSFLIGVRDSFSEEFVKGGLIGFSCDVKSFSVEYKKRWKEVIEQYKRDRDFYKDATARILVDSEPITVIEYADTNLDKCIVQIFTKTVYANELIIYPVVDKSSVYLCNSNQLSGKDILENGILIDSFKQNDCKVIDLVKVSCI